MDLLGRYNGDEPMAMQRGGNLSKRVEPTLDEILMAKRERLADELAKVDKAIDLLKSNPGMQEVIDALRQVG